MSTVSAAAGCFWRAEIACCCDQERCQGGLHRDKSPCQRHIIAAEQPQEPGGHLVLLLLVDVLHCHLLGQLLSNLRKLCLNACMVVGFRPSCVAHAFDVASHL